MEGTWSARYTTPLAPRPKTRMNTSSSRIFKGTLLLDFARRRPRCDTATANNKRTSPSRGWGTAKQTYKHVTAQHGLLGREQQHHKAGTSVPGMLTPHTHNQTKSSQGCAAGKTPNRSRTLEGTTYLVKPSRPISPAPSRCKRPVCMKIENTHNVKRR